MKVSKRLKGWAWVAALGCAALLGAGACGDDAAPVFEAGQQGVPDAEAPDVVEPEEDTTGLEDAAPDLPDSPPQDAASPEDGADDVPSPDDASVDPPEADVPVEDAQAPEDVEPPQPDADEPPPVPDWWEPPLETPAHEWTWVDFPDTRCADGSITGLGINYSPGADKVLLYMEGGGACWDYNTCFGPVSTALHLDGFNARTFDGLITDVYLNSLLFDRDDARNPFADAHIVFLPYCTADVFGGDRIAQLEGPFGQRELIHFRGRANLEAYLARLVPTFQDVDKVVLSGSSAGGFGAGFSWPLVQERFGDIRVDVLDDSGPPLDPDDGLWAHWQEAWNVRLPEGCDGCERSVAAVRDHLTQTMVPGRRLGLLSFTRDTVISAFFGLLPIIFEERLRQACGDFEQVEGANCFVVRGRLHTLLLLGAQNTTADSGLPMWRWIEQMVEDDPEWSQQMPR